MSKVLKLIIITNIFVPNAFAIKPQFFNSKVLKSPLSKSSSNLDIIKQDLYLDFDLVSGLVSVEQVIDFKTTRGSFHVNLDAGMELKLSKLQLNSNVANYKHGGSVLTIIGPFEEDQVSKLEVRYTFNLNSNPAFTVMKSQGRIWQASTFVQPSKAREWFVTNDRPNDKFQLEVRASVNEGYSVMSNGNSIFNHPEAVIPYKDKFAYKLIKPIPSYLVSIAIGKFHKYLDSYGPIEMSYWLDDFSHSGDLSFFYETKQMMSFLESKLTAYPFNTYNITAVRTMAGGGMEHTTTTTLSSEAVLSHYGRVTSLHELAHHWFGDAITCQSWDDIWLNESFATFMELSYVEASDGKEAYLDELYGQREVYLNSEQKNGDLGPIVNFETTPEQKIFSQYGIVTYYKGSLVLNYLKQTLGEKVFFQALNQYINDPSLRHKTANTSDLKRHLEAESGRDLTSFFQEFIYRKGRPELLIEEVSRSRYKITQTSYDDIGLFHLNIPVIQGNQEISVTSEKQETFIEFVLPQSNLVYFDPDQFVPGVIRVRYQKATAKALLMQKTTSYRYAKRILEELELEESEWRNLWVFSSLRTLNSAPAILLHGVRHFNLGTHQLLSALESSDKLVIKRDLINALSSQNFNEAEKVRLARITEESFENKDSARFIITPLMKLANVQEINLTSLSLKWLDSYEKIDGAMVFKELLSNILINKSSAQISAFTSYLFHSFNKVRRRAAQVFGTYKQEEVTNALGKSLLQAHQFSDYTAQDDYIIEAFLWALDSHHSVLAKDYITRFKNSSNFSRKQIEQAEKILISW